MNKKQRTEADYAAFILEVVSRWKPRLNLSHFIVYEAKDEDIRFLACRYNYPYFDTTILWTSRSFGAWVGGDPDHERRIVHELCHLITDPFYTRATDRYLTKDVLEDERERLTDHIATMAFRMYGASRP